MAYFSISAAVVGAETEKEAELSFLKAQINPHFLFSTLINTKQRLDYLYKEKYDLRTDQSNGIYTVRLRLRN